VRPQAWKAVVGPVIVAVGAIALAVSTQGWNAAIDAEFLGFAGAMGVLAGSIQVIQHLQARRTRRRFKEYLRSLSGSRSVTVLIRRTGVQVSALSRIDAVGVRERVDPRRLDSVHVLEANEWGLSFFNLTDAENSRRAIEVSWPMIQSLEMGTVSEGLARYRGLIVELARRGYSGEAFPLPLLLWDAKGRSGGVASVDAVQSALDAISEARPPDRTAPASGV